MIAAWAFYYHISPVYYSLEQLHQDFLTAIRIDQTL